MCLTCWQSRAAAAADRPWTTCAGITGEQSSTCALHLFPSSCTGYRAYGDDRLCRPVLAFLPLTHGDNRQRPTRVELWRSTKHGDYRVQGNPCRTAPRTLYGRRGHGIAVVRAKTRARARQRSPAHGDPREIPQGEREKGKKKVFLFGWHVLSHQCTQVGVTNDKTQVLRG